MHGVPLMTWSPELAAGAQQWADKMRGVMEHSGWKDRWNIGGFEHVGENLMLGVTDYRAVDGWYNEIRYTQNGLVSSFSTSTGHYTQVVWRASIGLGCGAYGQLLVCWYGPAGNFGGEFTSNVNSPVQSASQCPG